MTTAVFDINILISAVISQGGSPFKCLELARQGLAESVTCQEILDEFREKLIGKLKRTPAQADSLVDDFRSFTRVVAINGTLKVVAADPDDDKVIECAVQGNATHIVTGDTRHLLPLVKYQHIPIIRATDFVALLTE